MWLRITICGLVLSFGTSTQAETLSFSSATYGPKGSASHCGHRSTNRLALRYLRVAASADSCIHFGTSLPMHRSSGALAFG